MASKGRFDRAISSRERAERGLPSAGSITKEAFMRDTKDVWEIAPESATRVGHPAPFPVALPGRLIELYTYYDDLILDPYMGSGTTAVAAVRTQRRYVGCESEAEYLHAAEARIDAERERLSSTEDRRIRVVVPPVKGVDEDAPTDPGTRAVREVGRPRKSPSSCSSNAASRVSERTASSDAASRSISRPTRPTVRCGISM